MVTPAAYLLGPQKGEQRRSEEGAVTSFKASGETTDGRLAVIEDLAARGDGTPLHRHTEDEESFYVLEGTLSFWLDAEPPLEATTGTFVHIPAGVAHAFRVESERARYLIITTPKHGEFYRAISDPVPAGMPSSRGEMDMARVEAACEKFGVEILGLLPDSRSA